MAQSFKSIVVEVGGYKNVAFLENDARIMLIKQGD